MKTRSRSPVSGLGAIILLLVIALSVAPLSGQGETTDPGAGTDVSTEQAGGDPVDTGGSEGAPEGQPEQPEPTPIPPTEVQPTPTVEPPPATPTEVQQPVEEPTPAPEEQQPLVDEQPLAAPMGLQANVAPLAVVNGPSDDGVKPEETPGNPKCTDLGYAYGYKLEERTLPSGTYTFPGTSYTVTTNHDGTILSWSSTLGIDAVIVKGGQAGANIYTYSPEDFGDSNLHPPLNPSGQFAGISHIEFCYDFELQVSKTANAAYTRTYTWNITKSVDDAAHTGFPGDSFTSNYTVVVDQTVIDSDHTVNGTITISNPDPGNIATITGVTDTLAGGISATVSCTASTVPAGGSISCTYSASVPDKATRTNTVVVTTSGKVGGGSAMATATFGDPTNVVGSPQVNVTDSQPDTTVGGPVSGDQTFTYPSVFTCPTDTSLYSNSVYTNTVPNTAAITETGLSASQNVSLTCYIPVVTKDAAGSYVERHVWEVEKSVEPLEQSAFAGQHVDFDWTVDVAETVSNEAIVVSGAIMVDNPALMVMSVSLSDALDDGTVATIDECTGGSFTSGVLTIPASTTAVCTYSAAPADITATKNTATATLNGVPITAEAAFDWDVTVIDPGVTLTDDQYPFNEPLTENFNQTYADPDGYTCSDDPADYVAGSYTYTEENTAVITGEEVLDQATASTSVTCYAPVVSKTAAGAYDERHEWTIEKSVDPVSQDALAGETVDYTWTVVVTEDVFEENFAVSGQITVYNPAPMTMQVTLADVLDDGTPVTIDACTGGVLLGSLLSVSADETATCDYSAEPTDRTATLNTATATLNTIDFVATDPVEWTPTVIRGSATVDDDQNPDFPQDIIDGDTFTYAESYTCSTDARQYGDDGAYLFSETNVATVSSDAAEQDNDDATVDITCYAPLVSKTVATYFTRTWDWTIAKGADATYNLFTGDSVTHAYTVSVTPDSTDNGWGVNGSITITNPHPTEDMTLTSVTDLAGGISAPVTCLSLVVPAAGSLTCTYDTGAQDSPDDNPFGDTNTATAVFAGANWTGSQPIVFSANPTTEDNPVITVDDDKLTDENWTASRAAAEWTYERTFTCDTDEGEHLNTATILETEQSDTATVTVNCYALQVTKDATPTFTRTWDWTIVKGGDQTDLTLAAGETFIVNYDVTVSATSEDSAHAVGGTISIHNPAPIDAELTAVADIVSPDIKATVDCAVTFPYTLAAGATLPCDYSAGLPDDTDRTNTATASLQNYSYDSEGLATAAGTTDFSGTANVTFTGPTTEVDECINVSDDQYGALGTVCADDLLKTFTYSLEIGPYGACGLYTYTNTASFVTNDSGSTGSDSHTVNVDVPCLGCTLTQGYWKTHSEFGPAPYDDTWALLANGANTPFFLSGKTYYQVLWTPPAGNAYYNLARQYIAAELNILNEADDSAVSATMASAKTLLQAYTPAQIAVLKGNSGIRKQFIALAGILAWYNEGLIGPGHCDEDSTSAS